MTAHSTTVATPPRLDRSLIAALIGNFLIRLDGGMVGLLLTFYLTDLDRRAILEVSATTLGLLASAYYIVELIGAPIMGAKCDEYGNRRLLLVGPFVGMLAALVAGVTVFPFLQGLAHVAVAGVSIFLLALGVTRLLQGFAAATSIPSILSYLSAHTEGSLALRGRVMSIFEITTAIGLLVGPIVGAQLWKVVGAWGFMVTAVLFLTSAAFFWTMRDDHTAHHRRVREAGEPLPARFWRVLRRGDLLSFAPAWLAINAIVGLWGTHLIYQMRNGAPDDRQFLTGFFSENTISLVLGGYGAVFCASVIAWGFSFGRLRETTVMRASLLGILALGLATLGVNHSGGAAALIVPFALLAAVGLAIQSGFAPAALTYLARLSARSAQDRGLVMGIYSVVLGLGQFIGILLGGPFADAAGVDGILILTALLGLVATWSVLRLNHAPASEHEAAGAVEFGLHAD